MTAPLAPAAAILEIERQLLNACARCECIRYIAYPDPDLRLVLVCAQLADGNEIQVLARLDFPIAMTGDDYDEAAVARAFRMPSELVH